MVLYVADVNVVGRKILKARKGFNQNEPTTQNFYARIEKYFLGDNAVG